MKKGITLIALIITIIIMLILAGVAITLIIGENGIFWKAKYAKEKYMNAEEQENMELAKLEGYLNNSRETVTISKEEYDELKSDIRTLQERVENLDLTVKSEVVCSSLIREDTVDSDGDYTISDISKYKYIIVYYGCNDSDFENGQKGSTIINISDINYNDSNDGSNDVTYNISANVYCSYWYCMGFWFKNSTKIHIAEFCGDGVWSDPYIYKIEGIY